MDPEKPKRKTTVTHSHELHVLQITYVRRRGDGGQTKFIYSVQFRIFAAKNRICGVDRWQSCVCARIVNFGKARMLSQLLLGARTHTSWAQTCRVRAPRSHASVFDGAAVAPYRAYQQLIYNIAYAIRRRGAERI